MTAGYCPASYNVCASVCVYLQAVEAEEMQQVKGYFDATDEDGGGSLDQSEIGQLICALGESALIRSVPAKTRPCAVCPCLRYGLFPYNP